MDEMLASMMDMILVSLLRVMLFIFSIVAGWLVLYLIFIKRDQ